MIKTEQTFDPVAYRLACKEMQVASTSSRLWLAKTREFEEEIRDEKAFLSQRHKQRAVASATQLWHFDWSILKSIGRLAALELQHRKFSFYHALCLGRVAPEQFDLEALKTISPKVLLGEPKFESGKMLTYSCPINLEKTPSFMWYKKTNSYYCFSCAQGGDLISLFMKLNNCDFKE